MSAKRRNPKAETINITLKLEQALDAGASEEIILGIIKSKANINHQNEYGAGFLIKFIKDPAVLQKLLKCKADPKLPLKSGGGPLHYAVTQGQLEAVKLLLAAKADIEETNLEGNSTLFTSILSSLCPISITNYLLKSGAQVDRRNRLGRTPLMIAAALGNLEKIDVLLDKKADVRAADKVGVTVLHHAMQCVHAKSKLINKLISKLDQADLNTPNNYGTTPLMTVARQGNLGQLRVLLDAKADAQAVDQNGNTALMHVFQRAVPDMDILRALIPVSQLNAASKEGGTALMGAAIAGSLSGVKLLLKAKADLELTERNGFRAVDLSEQFDQLEVFELLSEYEIAPSEPSHTSSSETASSAADKDVLTASSEKLDPAETLRDAKAPSARPLIERFKSAIVQGDKDLIRQLLAEESHSDLLDKEDNNLLSMAILAKKPKIALQLLKAGIPANHSNKKMRSPLMLAAIAGYFPLVNKLLGAKASLDQQDINGHTPLMLAAKYNHELVVKRLLDANAALDLLNQSGNTALSLAKDKTIQEMLRAAKRALEAAVEAEDAPIDPAIKEEVPSVTDLPQPVPVKIASPTPGTVEEPEEGWVVHTKRSERKAINNKPVKRSQPKADAGARSSRKPRSVASYHQKSGLQSEMPLTDQALEKPLVIEPEKQAPAPVVKPDIAENNLTALSTQPPAVSAKPKIETSPSPESVQADLAQTLAVSTSSPSPSTFASLQSQLTTASLPKSGPELGIQVEKYPHAAPSTVEPAASPARSIPILMTPSPAASPTTSSTSLFVPDPADYTVPEPHFRLNCGTAMDIKGTPPFVQTPTFSYPTVVFDEHSGTSHPLPALASSEYSVISGVREKQLSYVLNQLQSKTVAPDVLDDAGNSLLMLAINTGQLLAVAAIIHYCPVSDHKNKAGDTALLLAVKGGIPDLVDFLLKKGANRRAKDTNGYTALMLAVEAGNDKMINTFFTAEPTRNFIPDEINFTNYAGQSALFIAVGKCNLKFTAMLLDRGANRILRDKQGYSALMRAVGSGSLSLVMEFLKSEQRFQTVIPPEINFKNSDGDTALILAVKAGNPQIVDALLKSGANTFEKNNEGLSAQMVAYRLKNQDIINLFQKPLSNHPPRPSPLALPYHSPLPQLYTLVPQAIYNPLLTYPQAVFVLPQPVYQRVLSTAAFFQAPDPRPTAINPVTDTEASHSSTIPGAGGL